jgi:hypothetical protein
MCEIDSGVVDAAKQYFSDSTAVSFDDPRVELLIMDAAKSVFMNRLFLLLLLPLLHLLLLLLNSCWVSMLLMLLLLLSLLLFYIFIFDDIMFVRIPVEL